MRERYTSVYLDVEPSAATTRLAEEVPERPFHLLVIADLSARALRSESARTGPLPAPQRVDRDDLDDLLRRLAPRVPVALEADAVPLLLQFRALDDFHPDTLFTSSPLFARLRDLRRRAADPSQASALAAELGLSGSAPPEEVSSPPPVAPIDAGGGLLDLVLAETQPAAAALSPEVALESPQQLNRHIAALVRPHLVPGKTPLQSELSALLDGAVQDAMRAILHHGAFRQVEALWRGLLLLVREIETSPLLRIDVLDATTAELDAALAAGWTPRSSAPDVTPALVVPLDAISGVDEAATRLLLLARACADAGSACVAGIPPQLAGVPSTDALDDPDGWEAAPSAWEELRRHPAARHLAALLPRPLLRMPYGADGDECDTIPFEELDEKPSAEEFLWGNAALVPAILIARAYSRLGWEMRPDAERDLHGLPTPLTGPPAARDARPPLEVALAGRSAEALLERGVLPLLAQPDGSVRLARVSSISEPAMALAGPWSTS